MFTLIFCCLIAGQRFELTPQTPVQPVPESMDIYLQGPAILEIDQNDHIYVLDWVARVIFHWDDQGKFVNIIGTPGQGPEEFNFQSGGGPQGYLQCYKDQLFIYDGGKRAVMVFKADGTYVESMPIKMQTGRTNAFYVLNDGTFVFLNQNFMKQIPTRTLSQYGRDGEFIKDLIEIEDQSFKRDNDGNRVTGIEIIGYSATMIAGFNSERGELMAGFSGEPSFTLIETPSETKTPIKVGLIQQEVTQEDKDEFNEMPWLKNNQFFRASFPEKKSFYDAISPVGDKGYLVYSIAPHSRKTQGLYVNREGKTLGRFQFNCGENGSLQSSKGRIFGIYLDEEDEFAISELTLTQK